MRVIFLNRFYWPEEPATAQLLTDLAETLAATGHEVIVIASRPAWSDMPRRESHTGVMILRVTTPRWARLGLLGKAVDFLTFHLGALVQLGFTARRGDRVVALTDPPLLGVGTWLVARLCGARSYHWVQDVYPEIAAVLSGHSWLRCVSPLRDLAWRRSDGCVALGAEMKALITRAGVPEEKIALVPNWAPAGLTAQPRAAADSLRAAWDLTGKFIVAYSGNLGRVHDLEPVLEVAAALRDEPNLAFVFIGHGARRAALEASAHAREFSNVHFFPAQPRVRLAESLALGDAHLVTLLPGCGPLVFPSKLYGVAAVGRPVLFLGPAESDVARLVTTHDLGRAFAATAIMDIAAVLRAWHGDPALCARLGAAAAAFGREHSGPARAALAWEKLLATAD